MGLNVNFFGNQVENAVIDDKILQTSGLKAKFTNQSK